MKKILLVVVSLFSLSYLGAESTGGGIKAGLSYNYNSDAVLDGLGKTITAKGSNTGYFFGFYYTSPSYEWGLFLQPEILYSRYENGFSHKKSPSDPVFTVSNFNQSNLEINLLIGKKFFELFNLKAGPTGLISLGSNKNDDIEVKNNSFRLGYQLGAGIQLGPLNFDVAYRGSFKSSNGKINLVDGSTIGLDQRLSQFIISLGYRF